MLKWFILQFLQQIASICETEKQGWSHGCFILFINLSFLEFTATKVKISGWQTEHSSFSAVVVIAVGVEQSLARQAGRSSFMWGDRAGLALQSWLLFLPSGQRGSPAILPVPPAAWLFMLIRWCCLEVLVEWRSPREASPEWLCVDAGSVHHSFHFDLEDEYLNINTDPPSRILIQTPQVTNPADIFFDMGGFWVKSKLSRLWLWTKK